MNDNSPAVTDAALVQRLLAGEPDAFEVLVKRYHLPMQRVAAAIVGQGEAEEAVQEAWMAVMRHLGGFRGDSSLKTWLFTIVSNEAKSRLRKARREVPLDGVGDDGSPQLFSDRFDATGHWRTAPPLWDQDSPEGLLSFEDFRRCLEKVIERLPENQRAAMAMCDMDGLPLDEICNILGVSASNVRVLIHRARLKVYAMVEHYEETGTC
ncbi:MAG: RNA polymerase sigma factor [Haliea sp.]|jgi:RNA polymerase sigma-70 factor (ECF subfamily)|nr:RNA polymerase sigma factor [Haliea sp.]